MRRTLVVPLLVFVIGCGGDDAKNGEGGGGAPPKKDFVAQADAICRDANKREERFDLGGPGWHYGPKFGNPRFLSKFNAIGHDALRRLQALEPPAEEREAFGDVIASMEQMVMAIDQQIEGLRAGGKDITSRNVTQYEGGYTDLAVAASRAGITECVGVSV